MKNILLAFVLMIAVTAGHTQNSLKVVYQGVEVANDFAVHIDSVLTVGNYNEAIAYAQVKNISSSDVTVRVRRTVIDSVSGSQNQICFAGLCFSPDVWNSATTETLGGGGITPEESFSGHYLPNDNYGLTTIRYTFYNQSNVNDTASFIVNYNYGYLSVDDLLAQSMISSVYPNPARNSFTIDYQLSKGVNSASVKVYNIVGQEIKTESMHGLNGRCEIPVSLLPDGIYFVSVTFNGQAVKTQRLIIRR